MFIFTSHYEKDGLLMEGDRVKAISFSDAQDILEKSGRGHMIVDGILVGEVDYDEDTNTIDWNTYIDYEQHHLN